MRSLMYASGDDLCAVFTVIPSPCWGWQSLLALQRSAFGLLSPPDPGIQPAAGDLWQIVVICHTSWQAGRVTHP